jgi:queuine tRNA-ribosyltransferase
VAASASRAETERALDRTQKWWLRALAARTRPDQALFALVQGGLFEDLRRESARAAATQPTAGFAIGGFSIGEAREITKPLLAATLTELPTDRPRYLMGVGTPMELIDYSRLGVDLFDCVLPTRLARTGTAWLDRDGARLDLGKAALLTQAGPLVEGCRCAACRGWSRSALASMHHSGDQLLHRLLSIHNLTLLADVLREERERLLASLSATGRPSRSFTLGR